MRKAAAAGIILAGIILVAGGLDRKGGSDNFVRSEEHTSELQSH